MHAGRTSAVVLMSTFNDFHESLKELVDSYTKKDLMLKIESDQDSGIIKIFGEKMSNLTRAKSGLNDVSELAYTTAEHHPYWNLLYNACQISKITLDKWDSDFTKEDLAELSWTIDELKNAAEKLKEKSK